MIDLSTPVHELHPLEMALLLRRARMYFRMLARAGESANIFYSWIVKHRVRFVPLFDFDVICGSLPSVVARQRIEDSQSGWGRSELNLFLGPHSIAAPFFVSGDYKFTLPFGTLHEIFQTRKDLHGTLHKSAESWLGAFQRAMETRDPDSTLLLNSRHQTVSEILVDEFSSFTKGFDDVRLLEAIYSKHEPFENLVLEKPDQNVTRALKQSEKMLNERRKGKTLNNRCDALNISCVVRMFNNPVVLDKERPVPMFITETKELRDLDRGENWYDLSPFSEQPPTLFHRIIFLQVYLGFLAYHSFSEQIAAKEANLFARQARQLESKYARALEILESGTEEQGGHRREICPPQDFRYQCEAIEVTRRDFDDYWGCIIKRNSFSAEQDRILYINLLENRHFRNSIRARIGWQIKKGDWDGLVSELKLFKHPDFDSWRLLQYYSERAANQPEIDTLRDYTFTFKKNMGNLLCEERVGTSIDKFNKRRLQEEHELRFLIHHCNISSGCLLCMDTWRYAGQHNACLSFVWSHDCDKQTLWRSLRKFGTRVGRRESGVAPIRLEEFPQMASSEPEAMQKQLKDGGQCRLRDRTDSFELNFGNHVLFADVTPVDSVEMQAGLVVNLAEAGSLPVEEIASVIADTSLLPISKRDCQVLVRRLLALVTEIPKNKEVLYA